MTNKSKVLEGLFLVGRLLSPFYALVMILRARFYTWGLFKTAKLPVPVLSVGNLTMGGTGKTPVVMYLARMLARKKRPAIISRGYGGKSREPVNLVSDGEKVLLGPSEAGDEPVLMAQSLSGVPVVTGAKRAVTGQFLVEKKMADVLLMDDGFQHLALSRDLNLVLFSARSFLGDGWVFPGGVLRESKSALKRADAFVFTGVASDNCGQAYEFRQWLQCRYPGRPVFEGSYQPEAVISVSGQVLCCEELADVPLFAFCGIANPDSFYATLAGKFIIKGERAYSDHHYFTRQDLDYLVGQAKDHGCAALIVTEKDRVKLMDYDIPLPLWALRVGMRFGNDFDRFVLERLFENLEG